MERRGRSGGWIHEPSPVAERVRELVVVGRVAKPAQVRRQDEHVHEAHGQAASGDRSQPAGEPWAGPPDGGRLHGWHHSSSSMRKRPLATRLAAVAGVGLAIRLVYALAVMGGREPRGDGREFHLLANVLADTGRYLQPFQHLYLHRTVPTTEKPPLYPAVLALFSWVGLDSYAAHRVVSCVLGASAVVLIGMLGRRVAGDRIGLLAGAIAAVYPALWMPAASLRGASPYPPPIPPLLLAPPHPRLAC